MSKISEALNAIMDPENIYGKDIRKAIHDGIEVCYDDVTSPALNSEAFKAAVQSKIDDGSIAAMTIGEKSLTGDKLADETITKDKLGEDVQAEFSSLKEDLADNSQRLENIDGFRNLCGLFEVGVYDYSTGEKQESYHSIRSIDVIRLNLGDIVSLADYTKNRFFLLQKNNTSYVFSGWLTSDYCIADSGDYLIVVATTDGTRVDSLDDYIKIVTIQNSNQKTLSKKYLYKKDIAFSMSKNCYINDGNVVSDQYSGGYKSTIDIIPVIPNTQLTAEHVAIISSVKLSYFDNDGNFVDNIKPDITGTDITVSFTTPYNCYGIKFTSLSNSNPTLYYAHDIDLVSYLVEHVAQVNNDVESFNSKISKANDAINTIRQQTFNKNDIVMTKLLCLATANGTTYTYEYKKDSVSNYIDVSCVDSISFKNCVDSYTVGTGYCLYDVDKTFIAGKDFDGVEELVSIPVNARYLRFSTIQKHTDDFEIKTTFKTKVGDFYKEYRDSLIYGDLVGAFQSIGVIGDSLSSGACSSTSGIPDIYQVSWIQFMARKLGIKGINFSQGGLTTRTWFTSPNGYDKLINQDNKCQCYFIALGHNDAFRLGESYIGSNSDINMEDDSLNADTFYGNYAKIIQTIKKIQPKAKIFVLTIPNAVSPLPLYSDAIRAIAEMFDNVYLLDIAKDNLYKTQFMKTCIRNSHYNAVAYNVVANNMIALVSKFMYNNINEFLDIEFIGTNYQM